LRRLPQFDAPEYRISADNWQVAILALANGGDRLGFLSSRGLPVTNFDPVKYKNTTRDQWQAAAKAWNDWSPLLRDWLGPATVMMLDMAKVGRESRVLIVAAGAGDETLQVADRVGPGGYVLATDISSNILEFAADNARRAGYSCVETNVMDGEEIDVPEANFDAVISRVGLIYFPDQQKALTGMKRALKPGGHIGAMVYSTPENNKFFSLPVSVIRRRANLPPPLPGQPGPFSLGSPGVLDELFRKAGFQNVRCQTVAAPVRLKTAAECVRFEKDSFGALHQMLSGLDQVAREAAWTEIEGELRAFEGANGFTGPCEMIVGVGTN
jgi:SAM-dependent methyltransferase